VLLLLLFSSTLTDCAAVVVVVVLVCVAWRVFCLPRWDLIIVILIISLVVCFLSHPTKQQSAVQQSAIPDDARCSSPADREDKRCPHPKQRPGEEISSTSISTAISTHISPTTASRAFPKQFPAGWATARNPKKNHYKSLNGP